MLSSLHIGAVIRSVAFLSVIACGAFPAVPAVAKPPPDLQCIAIPADDGLEPPCNPHLADSAWAMGHRNSYAQASSPIAGPAPGQKHKHDYHGLGRMLPGLVVGALFSGPYADGRRVVWTLGVNGTNDHFVYKIDAQSRRVIDVFSHLTDERTPPTGTAALSGIYVMLDRDNHLIQPRSRMIEVYGDAVPGDRLSPIKSLHKFALPARALCGPDDELVGQAMLWTGHIAFVTRRGNVGVVPRDTKIMDDAHLKVASINDPDACATAADEELETVSNSLAADENGGIYPATDKAQYRFDFDGTDLEQSWRAAYSTGSGNSATRQDGGTGSTPTLMGTRPSDDKFVVITDGQDLTHLVLMWRDEIPADWQGLPGRDRRIACEFPIDFGDETREKSSSEQSVVVRGYASLVPNNELRHMRLLDQLLAPANSVGNLPVRLAIGGLLGGSVINAPHGFERIDWDPASRTCKTVWVNKEVSMPNGVPAMSSGSNMVYGVAQRKGVWGLEGLDFGTGNSTLWIRGSRNPMENSLYSALQVAEDGSLWTGALLGFAVYGP